MKKIVAIIAIILTIALAGCQAYGIIPTEATAEVVTEAPTQAPTEMPTEPATEAPTESTTEPTTEAPSEADAEKIRPVAGYHVTDAECEGGYVTTSDGHCWEIDNPNNYSGIVEVVYYHEWGYEPADDILILVMERG